jgi:hypothetical protein
MQLVDARDGGERLATDVIREDQIEDVAKISAALQGLRNPLISARLNFAAPVWRKGFVNETIRGGG